MLDKKRKRQETQNISFTIPPMNQKELKAVIVEILNKEIFKPPFDSQSLFRFIKKSFRNIDYSLYVLNKLKINDIIREFIERKVLSCEEMVINMRRCFYIKNINYDKLRTLNVDVEMNTDYDKYIEKAKNIMIETLKETKRDYDKDDIVVNYIYDFDGGHSQKQGRTTKANESNNNMDAEEDEEDIPEVADDQNFINDFLYAPTAKVMMNTGHFTDNPGGRSDNGYISVLEKMQTKYSLRPFCQHGTTTECSKKSKGICNNVHFRPIIKPHTDVSLGDCSYLDTCRHMEICKFVHYQIEDEGLVPSNRKELVLSGDDEVLDSQWVNCDIRYFDFKILGKFDVIMADPPWDIHMDLPYGTLSDEEMKNLRVQDLQDHGVIFLWVTGRATELARECLELWGYERKEELVWIKTNQLQRLIRTGRTGHWLNHSKEHCLIGYKGNPKINRNFDCDVLVSEVRETSRKPDEIYELIERMRPGGRKMELFARAHNRRKGWISLGNQLPGVYFVEPELIERFNNVYPDEKLTPEVMNKNKESSIVKKAI
jgi:mRNA (2'-O-methyladenosine-N6-)-methyltransferase